jgi:5-methylcytosine-specific restriction protein A
VRREQRTPEAQAYRRWYGLAVWTRLRSRQLASQPLCERHLKDGTLVPADTVNHRSPHKGDWTLFADPDNLESVCTACHASVVQAEERGRYQTIGADGWPI